MPREQQYQLAQKPPMFDPGPQQGAASRLFGDKSWYRQIQEQKVLSEKELKQFFHDLDLKRYSANADERAWARLAETDLKKELAWNMSEGPNALRNRDGYVIIGDQAYGKNEAHEVARKDLDYFQKNDKHLPPLPYPTTPDLRPEFYPDVTKKVNNKLEEITRVIYLAKRFSKQPKLNGRELTYPIFSKFFPNNGVWDTQVGNELPGQIPEKSLQTGELQRSSDGTVLTKDQYAIFKGNIVRSGYISNYTFGYASAAAGFFQEEVLGTARAANLMGGQIGDNPKDEKAMKEGWEAYWKEHPDEKKPTPF